jgi:hypothetical protein
MGTIGTAWEMPVARTSAHEGGGLQGETAALVGGDRFRSVSLLCRSSTSRHPKRAHLNNEELTRHIRSAILYTSTRVLRTTLPSPVG